MDSERPLKHSEEGQYKYDKKTINSIDAFLLLLLVSYVGYCFKLFKMSWYKMMKKFLTNFKLV